MGAGGYIGGYLTKKLVQKNVEVFDISSSSGGIFDLSTGILDDTFLIPENTECIVYLSQSPFYRQLPDKFQHLWGVNVISPIKLAILASRTGVKKFIYASTGNIYAPSFMPHSETDPVRRDDFYALSKIHAEEGLRKFSSEMQVICTRIFGIYGPGQSEKLIPNLIKSIKEGSPISLAPKFSQQNYGLNISLCYIDDAVEIFLKIIESALPIESAINIAGNRVLNIAEITTKIGELLNIPPIYKKIETPRHFDLIANIDYLNKVFHPKFTPFDVGISKTLELYPV